MEPPSLAYSTSNRGTVQGDPGRAFRPAQGRNARAYSPETQYPPRCARRVLPRLRPGRRRVRPSRASPARLRCAPARLRRAYAIPRAPRLAWPVLRPPFGRARATPAATWSAMSTGLDTATRFPSSGASRRRCHPRATVMGNANGHRPLPPDPALLTEVAGQLPRQRPLRCRLRDLDLLVSRRPPGLPRMSRAGQARHGSCSNPGAHAPSVRHLHRVNA